MIGWHERAVILLCWAVYVVLMAYAPLAALAWIMACGWYLAVRLRRTEHR